MKNFQGSIKSKLPKQGTSIFATMSALSREHNAINLSQGFPDFEISQKLIALVNKYMTKGYNQYAPMTGVPELTEQISQKVESLYGAKYNPQREVNITSGATQALHTAIAAVINEEDEVIVFEPAYDAYVPLIKLHGGIVKYSELSLPDYKVNWEEVKKMISNRTRMIIINSPHNPTGSILSASDMKELEKITMGTEIIILSDEVYEHLIFDGIKHESICRYPGLAERSFVIGSFGKTFHATGWKTGFVLAPENLMEEFRKVHQFVVFASNTPVQYALAEFLTDSTNYEDLGKFYQRKRDLFQKLISGSHFKIVPSYGTYFQLLDYSAITDESEVDFAIRLTKEFKLASIPVSVFYHKNTDNNVLRFCFAKEEITLEKAAEILNKI
ncbi:MAG: aminotransferase class I/II-fold pyridoxal phosphate-dependent enzyme [Bacteroidales bacterium]|nr:aminotransferase class I/II-fold pyridoxal phosphate-dependent enzyme [Bacteroidales bacterium]